MDLTTSSFARITLANSISFYILNWIGLLLLIWMVFRIRHTGDETYLKFECVWIVGVWVFFSIIQYATFIYNYIVSCDNENGDISAAELRDKFVISYKVVYWVIIARDLCALIVMVIF